jgi:hypothetical protein
LLEVRFERDARRWDHVRVPSLGCVWSMPSYGSALPHDAIHLVVESAFELRRGLFGLVAAGADPDALNAEAHAARRAGRPPDGFGPNPGDLLTAEALAAVHWYDPEAGPARLRDIRDRCADFGASVPERLDLARCEEVVRVLRALRARFRAGGERALVLRYDVEEPRRGFEGMRSWQVRTPN